MENVLPPNGNPNAPEEEPFMDQAHAALVGFAPQWIGEQIPNNKNGWLEEEPEDEEEEEEEEEEENKAMEDDDEDDAKMINPYEKADPHNRPPPASDEEAEFAPPSSASRDFLEGNDEVCVPGPMPCDSRSVHRGMKRLSKQIHDRYKTKKRMARILRQNELRRNGQAFDITALDSAVRANTSESSKMMRLIMDLSREFSELKCQNRRAEELSRWEAWVRGRIPNSLRFQEELSIYIAPVPRADDPYVMVRDAARVPERMKMLTLLHLGAHDLLSRMDPHVIHSSLGSLLVQDGIAAAIRDEREMVRREATRAEGPMENTFEISECAKVRKVKFATATLHGRALTWWNSRVATIGREVVNARSWAEVKQMMTDEFCPTEEVQRLEDKLRHLKL
nr:putative reverse transcriptase domain-containing protein [Tanacetum cinerariifolium]